MYTVPLHVIVEKIQKEKNIPVDEINKRISKKMTELAGLVSADGAAHIIANELGVQIFSDEAQELKIKDIQPYMKHIKVTGKLIALFDLVEFKKDSNPGKVRNAILGDETGRIKVSFWHHATEKIENITTGTILRLSNISSKDNNGAVEISVSTPDAVEINPEGVTIDTIAEMKTPKKKIVELEHETAVTLQGVIVQSFKPVFYPVCPECQKKLIQGNCSTHGTQTPKTGMVLNVILDDGTDTIRCVFFNDIVKKVIATDIKETTPELEIENIRKKLIGTVISISGSLRNNNVTQQRELIASSIEL